MTTFRILLEYDGTRYSGWQDQKNARTVMGELKKAAREIFGEDVDIQGAGRTDAGVHALGQVMHLKAASQVRHSPDTIKRRMNDLIPADIVILDVERAERNFHARHDAHSRIYIYQISTRKQAFMKRLKVRSIISMRFSSASGISIRGTLRYQLLPGPRLCQSAPKRLKSARASTPVPNVH